MAVARERADNVHDAAFFDFERELNGVSLDCETDGCELSNLSLNGVRQAFERQRNIVYPPGKLLERVEVAARDLFSPIDDEDVIAELFRFAEDLRREDDGSSFLDFDPQKIHYLTLQDGIHPGREFIQEKHWCVDHKHFRDLNAAAETAAQVLHLAVDFRAELKFFDQGIGTARGRRFVQSLKARVGEQIVFHGQEQLDRCRLNHR